MTTLITGGGGFIGTHLAGLLVAAGERVVLVDRVFSDLALRAAPAAAERRVGDVTDRPGLWRTIDEVRTNGIVHLAAVLSGASEDDPSIAFDVNVLGTFNVLEGARRSGVKKVLVTSSVAAYDAPDPGPLSEESTPLSPMGVYGMTKALLESWCAFYRRRWAIDVRVVRPAAVVGPGREAGGAASNFTTAIIQEPVAGRRYVCPVAEDDAAPLVYHSDLVEGLAKLYRAPSVPSPVYNLGACSATAGELARLVRERLPGAEIIFQPNDVARYVVGRWRHLVIDNRLAAHDLGYHPQHDTPAKLVDAFLADFRALG